MLAAWLSAAHTRARGDEEEAAGMKKSPLSQIRSPHARLLSPVEEAPPTGPSPH
jgi:hypothetical protein